MPLLRTLGAATVGAAVGLVSAGAVAMRAVDWYAISSFEGKSGFFVVGVSLLGAAGGAVIGTVTAHLRGGDAPLATTLGIGALAVMGIVGAIGGTARLLADVPPTFEGEGLLLAFELQWPVGAPAPTALPGEGKARLGALSGRTLRTWGEGIFFTDDAAEVSGHWVVPGVASIFTTRGERLLEAAIGDSVVGTFLVPLPARPGAEQREWSAWLPNPRPGAPPLPPGVRYRFRIVKESEPVRRETVGRFTVEQQVASFYRVAEIERQALASRFTVLHQGSKVAAADGATEVAVVSEQPAALLLHGGDDNAGRCLLLVDGGGGLDERRIDGCATVRAERLTADDAQWKAARTRRTPPGWLDRESYAIPGLYRLSSGVLDTRSLDFTAVAAPQEPYPINGLPPASLSPDERRYAWYAHHGGEEEPVLVVTEWRTGETVTLPIDRARMRYNEYQEIGPAWVAHHFAWRRDADGADRLHERESFTPLPYRGDRERDREGRVTAYYLRPGGTALRDAMIDLLAQRLSGTRQPDELDGYHRVVRIGDALVKGAVVSSGGFVSIGMDFGSVDFALMARVADTLDAELATGRYDALFHLDPPPRTP